MEQLPLPARPVGDIVAEDYRRGSVLKRFGIDFCCGGKRTLEAAARAAGVDAAGVARAIAESDARGGGGVGPDRAASWSPAFLADYIVNEHHAYVREALPVLRAFTEKVAWRHGDTRPELVAIAERTAELAAEMEAHMASEEEVVFPRIRALASGTAGEEGPTLAELIGQMEGEHDAAGSLMAEMRRLSDGFTPPEGACATYCATYAKLEEFEADLHRHVHLENNVLFPKALALEEAVPAV
jgi:regulator of cell morphogenesis and NO signaling